MKTFLTVFALMVSVTGIAVSLAREEVRCYLGLSEDACNLATETYSSPVPKTASSKPQQTQETQQAPVNLPSSIEELTKVGQEIKEAVTPSDNSASEVTNPSPQAEEPQKAPTEVAKKPTEEVTEVSSPSAAAQPITEPVELEVIPYQDSANSSQSTEN